MTPSTATEAGSSPSQPEPQPLPYRREEQLGLGAAAVAAGVSAMRDNNYERKSRSRSRSCSRARASRGADPGKDGSRNRSQTTEEGKNISRLDDLEDAVDTVRPTSPSPMHSGMDAARTSEENQTGRDTESESDVADIGGSA